MWEQAAAAPAAGSSMAVLLEAAERLPTLPAVALEVLELVGDENATIDQLAYTIARDPALSAKLLRMANSSLFRRGSEVATLHEATMRLGLKTVKLMALGFSLADALPRVRSDRFDYDRFWRLSLVTTVAGRALARLVRSRREDEAFVCGLLARIGELVLAEGMPERYAELRARSGRTAPTPALEREVLGLDRFAAAAELLRRWRLPARIWQSVLHHGDPEALPDDLPEAVRELAVILHLADVTASLVVDEDKGSALDRLQRLARDHFGLSASETAAFVVGLESGISETALLLSVKLPSAERHEALLAQARMQLMELSLHTAADLEEATRRAEELERRNHELASIAHRDALTGLPNRARFDDYLREVVEARLDGRGVYALGLLMIDVDHFKRFNDRFGHPAGDAALRAVARAIAAHVRDTSFAARYGGEEFVVVLPNVTLRQLESIAERVRAGVADTVIEHEGRRHRLTVSVGGACVRAIRSPAAGPALIAQADGCLYEAKRAGRNRSIACEIDAL